jgi:hypothetical protein
MLLKELKKISKDELLHKDQLIKPVIKTNGTDSAGTLFGDAG